MDIFAEIDKLAKKGIIIDCVAVNQIENGYEEQVKAGSIPLITYTVEVMNINLDDILYTESCDSYKDALIAGIKWASDGTFEYQENALLNASSAMYQALKDAQGLIQRMKETFKCSPIVGKPTEHSIKQALALAEGVGTFKRDLKTIRYQAKVKGDAGTYDVWGIDWKDQKVCVYRASAFEWIPFAKIQNIFEAPIIICPKCQEQQWYATASSHGAIVCKCGEEIVI